MFRITYVNPETNLRTSEYFDDASKCQFRIGELQLLGVVVTVNRVSIENYPCDSQD